jgi:flagellar protein FlgJ
MPGPLSPDSLSAISRPPVQQARKSLRPPAGQKDDQRLKAACNDLEALFIHHMLSEMRKTVQKAGLTDGGRAEEIYTSLMDAETARQMAADGGIGLSSILLKQLGGDSVGNRPGRPKR